MTDLATDLRTMARPQRATTFRFDLLDNSNSFIGDLPVDMDNPPRLSNSINRTVKRQLSGLTLPPSVAADIDTLAMRVKPWMVFEDGTEYPLGVFVFADATEYVRLSGSMVYSALGDVFDMDGNMLDQLATIDQGSRGINFYNTGHSVYDALVQQMEAAGVIEYTVDATDARIAQPIVWKPNTKRLKVINDLCNMGGYYSLYFDNNGHGQVRQVPDLEAVEPTFSYDVGLNVFAETVSQSNDLLQSPNVYVVVNSAFTDYPVWGEWQVPSTAPHSYANRRYYVVKEFDVQGVESSAEARRVAKARGQADYSTYRWVTFSTAIDPTHDTFNVLAWKGDKYREQEWDYTFVPDADMRHQARRVWAADPAADLPEVEAPA